jgi:hypothetical protein
MGKVIYTAKQKADALERELNYRRRVYDHRVADGKMTKALADYQIEIFEAMLAEYREAEKKEQLI